MATGRAEVGAGLENGTLYGGGGESKQVRIAHGQGRSEMLCVVRIRQARQFSGGCRVRIWACQTPPVL
ncbi:MAG: hypothetical protein GX358_00330 [candidate division WS1 bacterium]|nr:hypothetical protein [candidate division WS1 bacterium]